MGLMRFKRVSALVLFVGAVGALFALYAYVPKKAGQEKSAEATVACALIAIKENDQQTIKSLLWSKSIDGYLAKKNDRYLDTQVLIRDIGYGLNRMSRDEIRRDVKALPNSRSGIVSKMARFYVPTSYRPYLNNKQLMAVRYSVAGKEMVDLVIREDDEWKLVALPPSGSSVRILKYRSLDDNKTYKDIYIEPPFYKDALDILKKRAKGHK